MNTEHPLIQRFRQLPRALQWASIAVVGFALFLAWSDYLEPLRVDWASQADRIESHVKQVRDTEHQVKEFARRRDLVSNIGPVRVPLNESEGATAFTAAVNDILAKHNASNPSFGDRGRSRMPRGALTTITSSERRIDRITAEVKFDARPEDAAAIIADLESSPHVEAVNSVRMTKDAGGRVKVHLTIEAWVQVADTAQGAV